MGEEQTRRGCGMEEAGRGGWREEREREKERRGVRSSNEVDEDRVDQQLSIT